MRKKGSIKQLESITIKIGGHKMDALFFLGVVTVLFGIVFAVLLSPKGQKLTTGTFIRTGRSKTRLRTKIRMVI